MFDVGFSELIVIGIVALVVIGPERLPKVARTAGLLLGRLQRYVNDVKADINRELQLDELKKLQADMQESARSMESSLHSEIRSIGSAVEQAVQPVVQASPAELAGGAVLPAAGETVPTSAPMAAAPSADMATGANNAPKA